MKKMKIVIKCEGLSVRTRDLGMGLSILNRIASNGIMNHRIIPDGFLDTISKQLDAANRRVAECLTNKSTWFAKVDPNYAAKLSSSLSSRKKPNWITRLSLAPVLPQKSVEKPVKKLSKNRKKQTHSYWTLEEDKILCDKAHLPARFVRKDYDLLLRHTKQAISTRFNKIKSGRLGKMDENRVKDIRTYLGTLTTGKNILKLKPQNVIHKKIWSKKEIKAIENNMDIKPSSLARLPELSERTLPQIYAKRYRILNEKRTDKTVSDLRQSE